MWNIWCLEYPAALQQSAFAQVHPEQTCCLGVSVGPYGCWSRIPVQVWLPVQAHGSAHAHVLLLSLMQHPEAPLIFGHPELLQFELSGFWSWMLAG